MRQGVVGFVVLAAVAAGWTLAIAAAPRAVRGEREALGWHAAAAVYAIGSLVCHQMPERSFHTAGVQWPVCARCTGLYASGAAGLLMWGALRSIRGGRDRQERAAGARPRLRAFTIAVAVPTAITVLTASLGIFDPSNAWRALLAAPLGGWSGGVLAAVLLGDLR